MDAIKRKHGPNITVATRHREQPRSYSHARVAVDQARSDVLALRRSPEERKRSRREILASLDMQLHAILRYLEGR
jgi:hypothetical protein